MTSAELSVLRDFILILVPASISGFVGYFSASIQYKVKKEELQKTNEFNARKTLFDIYQKRIDDFDDRRKYLSSQTASIIEALKTSEMVCDEPEATKPIIQFYVELLTHYFTMVPCDLRDTKEELLKNDFERTPEYNKLLDYDKKLEEIEIEETYESVKETAFFFSDIYNSLYRCHQLLLEKKAEGLLKDYLKG